MKNKILVSLKINSKSGAGFTLVELLIVVAILAILAAIVVAFLSSQIFKGRDARRKGDLDRIKIAIEDYEKDHNCYPLNDLVSNCNPGTGLQPYLNKIPCDPNTNAPYYYEHEDSVCPQWFRLYAKLDNPMDAQALPFCGGPNNNSFNYYVSSSNAPSCLASGGGGPGGDGGSTPPPSGGEIINYGNYYGCMGGVCLPIGWDTSRPGPVCDPNFQNSGCYGKCGPPSNECKSWK